MRVTDSASKSTSCIWNVGARRSSVPTRARTHTRLIASELLRISFVLTTFNKDDDDI